MESELSNDSKIAGSTNQDLSFRQNAQSLITLGDSRCQTFGKLTVRRYKELIRVPLKKHGLCTIDGLRRSRRWVTSERIQETILLVALNEFNCEYLRGCGRVHDADSAVEFEHRLAQISDWTMDVRQVVFDENAISMEFVMDVTFTKDTDDTPVGSVKAGDKMHPHMCSLYKLKDGKIAELCIFTGPERGSVVAPNAR